MPYFRFPCPLGEPDLLDYEKDDHEALTERFRKTLYYGKLPKTERSTLPLTDIAVELLQEAAPRKLGKIDQYMAANTVRENCISPCTMMMGMIYVNRLRTKNPEYLQQISSSDLFLISMMMASKFLYDEGVDEEVFNDEWANSADMETDDINQMERDFLSAIDWNLFVGDKEFSNVLHSMEASIALKQGIDRGWFTYTDLLVLSQDAKFNGICQEISKVVFVTSLTYFTGILTMIGSTVLVTSATATLGPIIHSQITPMPLPITDVLPIIEQGATENVTEKEPVQIIDQGPNLATPSIDYILAELMTVISLPSTIIQFWYSALDQMNSGVLPGKIDQTLDQQPLMCSDGPCLQTENTYCRNITNQQISKSWNFCSKCQSCRKNQNRGLQPGKHSDSETLSRICDINNKCTGEMFDWAVKCCCKHRTSNMNTDTVVRNIYADVLVGFNTGFLSPVYVTT